MAWLRLDDGFTKHPKFEGWQPAQRWAWLEVMEYCAKYRTRGRIPTDETLLPRSTTKPLLAKAERAGWCHRGDDGALWINDWDAYNPPEFDAGELQQRVEQAVNDYPEASANELARIVGGRRKAALDAIRRYRIGTPPVPASGSGNQLGTGSRARGPVPSRPEELRAVQSARADDDEPELAGEPGPNDDEPGTTSEQPSDFTHIRTIIDPAYLQEHIP